MSICDPRDQATSAAHMAGENAVAPGVGGELFALAGKVDEIDTDAIRPQDVAAWIREIAARQPVVVEGRIAEMWCSSKDLQVRVRHAATQFDFESWPDVGGRARVTIERLPK